MSTPMADASVLGIHPPSTVRIDLDGWVQEWPWHTVEILGNELVISVPLTAGRRRVVFYPYEHAQEDGEPGVWTFLGRQPFTVCAGAPQLAHSLN
jgi:hypothetical protein